MRRLPLLCLILLSLGGCAVPIALSVRSPVLGKNETGIWFRQPSVGTGNIPERAAKHCAAFGKDAVYRATLPMAQGFAVPVVVYDCVDPPAALGSADSTARPPLAARALPSAAPAARDEPPRRGTVVNAAD